MKFDLQAFNEWKNSDNVFKSGKNEYRCQCSLYKIKMTLVELKRYFKKEYLNTN